VRPDARARDRPGLPRRSPRTARARAPTSRWSTRRRRRSSTRSSCSTGPTDSAARQGVTVSGTGLGAAPAAASGTFGAAAAAAQPGPTLARLEGTAAAASMVTDAPLHRQAAGHRRARSSRGAWPCARAAFDARRGGPPALTGARPRRPRAERGGPREIVSPAPRRRSPRRPECGAAAWGAPAQPARSAGAGGAGRPRGRPARGGPSGVRRGAARAWRSAVRIIRYSPRSRA
jgi:hypothetical protein